MSDNRISLKFIEGDANVNLTLGYDINTDDGREFLLKTVMFLCENGMEPEVIKLRDMLLERAAELGVAQS